MKVIILCGGSGTRLKEETEFKPKPMVFIGNKPILWHIMKIYASQGFNEFILALGYKADYIKEFFLNQKAFTSDFTLRTSDHRANYYLDNRKEIDNFTITFVDTGIDTLPGERILRCKDYIPKKDKYFMVTYGDGVSNVDIRNLVRFHKKQKTIGTLTGINPRSKFGVIKIDDDNHVTKFDEKPVMDVWINGGYMIFDKRVFDYINPGEIEHDALKRLSAKKELSINKHTGFWYCMDTYKEVEDLNKLWLQPNPPWKIWK